MIQGKSLFDQFGVVHPGCNGKNISSNYGYITNF